jgi:drug/metabolite transporter (DMT)-like permease
MEMLIGGLGLIIVGLAAGEMNDLHLAQITTKSLIAVAYLVVFGSIIGFSSYIWLFHNTTPTRASTYAYVNPVVAVFIGWLVGGEQLPTRVALAAVLIIAAVAAITVFGTRKNTKAMENLGVKE